MDETFDRLYRERTGELNRKLDSGFRIIGSEIMAAFQTLHRIAWDSPWAQAGRTKCN